QQDQGLMHRTSMPENQGMLFVFKSVHRRAFWMKNTLIPLDMLFIAKDGTITQIHRNAQPLDETVIPSTHVVRAVLELNGGQSEKDGIQEGDRIVHPVFRNTLAQ